MSRAAVLLIVGAVATGVVLSASCASAPPTPLDTTALPTATTSAEALYITTGGSGSNADAAPTDAIADSSADAATGAQLPPEPTMQLDRLASCPRKHCWRGRIVPKPEEVSKSPSAPLPDLGREPPVAVWQEQMGAGVKLDFPRARGVDLLGVIVRGVVTVSPAEGGSLAALQAWGSFVAPGSGVTLVANDKGADVILIAHTTKGRLADHLAAVRTRPTSVYWDKRPGPLMIQDLQQVPHVSWAKGRAHAKLAFEKDRSPGAYLGALIMEGDVPVAAHAHGESWEVLLPWQASGSLEVSEGSEPRLVEVRPGAVITMPPGVQHSWKPAGDKRLEALQVFVPPGPEQRYRALAAEQ